MKAPAVAVVVALGLSVAFALLALNSPVKSLPGPATCTIEMTAASCQYLTSQSEAQVAAAQFPLWLYQSYVGIAEGFAVATALAFLFSLKLPVFARLGRTVAVPKLIRHLAAANVVFWILAFVAVVAKDWSVSSHYYVMGSLTMRIVETGGEWAAPLGDVVPVVAFVSLGMGTLAFVLVKAKGRRLSAALKDSVLQFVAPMFVLLTLGLLVFAPYSMIDHVTNLLPWCVWGTHLVSNWLVLIVASFLTLLGYAPLLHLSS